MEIRLEDYNFYIRAGRSDMRKSSVGLALIVQEDMGLRPFEKSVFLFCGSNRRTIKAIVWNGNGWLEIIKRLECGSSFKWPTTADEALRIKVEDLLLLLKGYDIWRQFPVYTPQLVG
ncbi:MAG: IS66 family insertion sequence element accessory protein TnpB [Sphaerochaetaceae bacterium]|jgi:transposase|nr:IS66 family insertion sequence element accessory protein TnpB [Spirochaetales bacterium]